MTDPVVLLQRFTVRYRTALLTKAAVVGLLGLGSSGLLAWRLGALGLPPRWAVGVPASLALASASGLGLWVRRRWLSQRGAAAHLDRVLGLQQRLITAEEFAQAPHRPSLYPLLLEDAARQYATGGIRLPKPFDHTAGILVVMALLLLLWPRLNSVLPPFARQPEPETPPPQQPPPPEAVQDSRQEQEHQQGASSSQQSASGAQGAENREQGRGRSGPGAPDAPQQSNDTQRAGDQSQQSGSSVGQSPSQQSATGQQQAQDQQAAGGTQQSGQRQEQQTAQEKQQTGHSKQQTGQQQNQRQQTGQKGQQQQQAQGQQQAAQQRQQSPGAREGSGQQGSGQTFGEGEALKAEIQELLKEVSGELKNLQAQLASATDQPKPEAGTGTDPNLYEAPMKLEEGGGDPLSIQLQTDAAQTKSQRPGSGVGRPSGEVSHDAPRTEAQDAQLSEQPLEETPASRQPVPAEYRSVFDRLQRRDSQPSKSNP